MRIWRRQRRPACREAEGKCEFNVVHTMLYNSPDGRVFRVRRLVCRQCGARMTVAKSEPSFVPPSWRQEAAVEANF